MTYENARYETVIFYGDATSAPVVANAFERVAQLTDVRLAIKAFRNHESPRIESFRKRRFSDAALANAMGFIQSGVSSQLFLFDEHWSRNSPPQVLVHAVTWAAGRNSLFFLAAFREPAPMQNLSSHGQQWFQLLNGTSGGVVRCPSCNSKFRRMIE